mgnify:CR=1 FL=1
MFEIINVKSLILLYEAVILLITPKKEVSWFLMLALFTVIVFFFL